ncbi:helix-turn-helix transcriptional regulator [Paucibacter sp. APW11]|uniref:Helix-turn-helix transcriptional regulator n=1 Tax=Roseateles aquae TaxID=3077235 RepID=A0ABU3PIP1_9BURK|nr:helix-turn-helix transcriptional regulator [Paucibacter sp. APW11]MDT9002423.1 helix-turn-helix transcriptional regulator [Paucibacter sp. APW11]
MAHDIHDTDDTRPRADAALAEIAQCIAEPVRARMLCCLLDGHARTATELAAVGEVAASTASSHLARMLAQGLIACQSQGRHRYYRLAGGEVGAALEALLVVAARVAPAPAFKPSTPEPLREARRCYDHMAGHWAVRLHDHALRQGWIAPEPAPPRAYGLSPRGRAAFAQLGVDVDALPARRRLACACMDWSERRPHLGGALGAAWLTLLLQRRWVEGELDSRALRLTHGGRQGLERLLAA